MTSVLDVHPPVLLQGHALIQYECYHETSQAIGKMKRARLLEHPISVQWAFVNAKQHRRCDRTLGMPYPPTVTCLLRIRDVPMAQARSIGPVGLDHFSEHQQLRTFARAESTGPYHMLRRALIPASYLKT